MDINDFIQGLEYYEGKYSSIVRVNDDKKTVIVKNITYKDFLEIKKIDLDIIENIDTIDEVELPVEVNKSILIIKRYLNKLKTTKSDK